MEEIVDFLTEVKDFHGLMNQPVRYDMEGVPFDRAELRISLLEEELSEWKKAVEENDKVEQLDALCDMAYVLMGAVIESGFTPRFKEAFQEVHRSNMSKVDYTPEDAELTRKKYADLGIETYTAYDSSTGAYVTHRSADRKVLKSHKYSPAELKQFFRK